MTETERDQFSPKTPLPGSVQAMLVRCGKPNCRCSRGELHGPYWWRVWRDSDRTRKAYVRLANLEAVRAACARYHELHPSRRAFRRMLQKFGALNDLVIAYVDRWENGHDR